MTYKNCFFCTKRYYQKKTRQNQQRICDKCLISGLTDINKSVLISTCIVCNVQYKHQTGSKTKCPAHVHCHILNCGFCQKTTGSYSKQTCNNCDTIVLNIKNDTNDTNLFKQNYKLALTYYDEPEIEEDDYAGYWSDDNYRTSYHINPLKFRNRTKLLLKDIDMKYVDGHGNIDVTCPQLRYYHGDDGYSVSQARIIKASDLINMDNFKDDVLDDDY